MRLTYLVDDLEPDGGGTAFYPGSHRAAAIDNPGHGGNVDAENRARCHPPQRELDYEDGALEDTPLFRGQIVAAIRRFRPDVALFTDPLRTEFYLHRDHRIAGTVTLDALFPYARDRLHYPDHESEGLLPHKTPDALMWGSESPDTFINITGSIDKKIEALVAHKTQIPSCEESDELANLVKVTAARVGSRCDYKYAEGFRRISFSL